MGMTPHGLKEREQMDCPSAASQMEIESGDLEMIERAAADVGTSAARKLFDRPSQRPELVRRIEAILLGNYVMLAANREDIAKLAAEIADAIA